MNAAMIVAIDGPAGSGKSSVSKAVARQKDFAYLDTGAAYRVLAWSCLHQGVDLDDEPAVLEELAQIGHARPLDPDSQVHTAHGIDVSEEIRGDEVSASVSRVARHLMVRRALNDGFIRVATECDKPGILIEGRDITTVVAPDAPVRILLTADEHTRIARRQAELADGDASGLVARDRADSQVVDFLTAADGVWTVDTTHLSFEQSVQAVIDLIDQATTSAEGVRT